MRGGRRARPRVAAWSWSQSERTRETIRPRGQLIYDKGSSFNAVTAVLCMHPERYVRVTFQECPFDTIGLF
jgi:hypothetical protein